MVDLGSVVSVANLSIWGRTTSAGYSSQSSGLEVRVGSDSTSGGTNNPICASGIAAAWTTNGVTIACNAVGRYLTIRGATQACLSLCEVQVYSGPSLCPTGSFCPPGTASSTAALPNLLQWLDASNTSSLSTTYPSLTAVTSSGQSVSSWSDQSGNGASIVGTGNQPAYSSSLLNGLPGINFGGAARLKSANTFVKSTDVTLFWVGEVTSSVADWGSLWGHFTNHDYDIQLRHPQPSYANNQNVIAWYTAGDNLGCDLSFSASSPVLYSATLQSGTSRSFSMTTAAGGTSSVSATNSLTMTAGSANIYVGADELGGSFNGYISEILYFQRVLAPSEISTVSSYLAEKWGISASVGVPILPVGGSTSSMSFGATGTGTYTAFSTTNPPFNQPNNCNDNGWIGTVSGASGYVNFDFGSLYSVTSVAFYSVYNGGVRGGTVSLLYSSDNSIWTTLSNSISFYNTPTSTPTGSATCGYIYLPIPAAFTARYVKLTAFTGLVGSITPRTSTIQFTGLKVFAPQSSVTAYSVFAPQSGTAYSFTAASSSFTVNTPAVAQVLLVGGGGGGGHDSGGGGGGGGVVYVASTCLAAATYTITVGAGGAAATTNVVASAGGNTVISANGQALWTALGGGGGYSAYMAQPATIVTGGSGGGQCSGGQGAGPGLGTSGQGNSGGLSTAGPGGGGGGAGSVGGASQPTCIGGKGGIGLPFTIASGTPTYYGAGGGGGMWLNGCVAGTGGLGGGGNGGLWWSLTATNGVAGTGGGGGGEGYSGSGAGSGGSGVVIIRLSTQSCTPSLSGRA